jgi:hypothetical protein
LLKKISDLSRKVPEYESKFMVMAQEIEKVGNAYRGKADEADNL